MKLSISITILFLNVYSIHGQCLGNLITNGSFTSSVGEDVHASGWNADSTPDVNDANGKLNTSSGYIWIDAPHPSHDGGTWQNLYSDREYLEQTIDLKVGETYTLRFEYAAQGIEASSMRFASPVGINLYIDGELVFKTPFDFTQYTWENVCYSFKAKKSSTTIRLSASSEQYVGLDGICLILGDFCKNKAAP